MEHFDAEDLERVGEAAEMVAEGMRQAVRNIFDSSRQLLRHAGESFAGTEREARSSKEKEQEQ